MRKRILFLTSIFLFLYIYLQTGCSQEKVVTTVENYNPKKYFTEDCVSNYKENLVKAVCDGDTIVVETTQNTKASGVYLCSHDVALPSGLEKIRLIGIDAFEIGQKPYGRNAKEYTSEVLFNMNVCIEIDKEEKDVYGRTLGYVFVSKVKEDPFLNESLVKYGLAVVSTYPPNIKYLEKLKSAQTIARDNMFGVWFDSDYIAETPSEYRKRMKKSRG